MDFEGPAASCSGQQYFATALPSPGAGKALNPKKCLPQFSQGKQGSGRGLAFPTGWDLDQHSP